MYLYFCKGDDSEFIDSWCFCLDCRMDVGHGHEWYMVHDEVWAATNLTYEGGVLCIGCLEARIGRPLRALDFTDAPCNSPTVLIHSKRLSERLAA